MLNIEEAGNYRVSLLHLGFRPFFLLAGLFAIVSVGIWAWLYHAASQMPELPLAPVVWHGHEMIYGYALAVIAGFLLTAVRNWTNVQTLHGFSLLLLSLLWLGARGLIFVEHPLAVNITAAMDLLFNIALVLAVSYPVLKARQWKQLGVVVIPLLLGIGNGVFYAGYLGGMEDGTSMGINLGLYLVVLLIMVMGRRVVPFFIEKGIAVSTSIRNRLWVDIATIVFMLVFILLEVFMAKPLLVAGVALLLLLTQAVRLYDWHRRGIWRKPLLWSLYLSFAWITLGFALKAAGLLLNLNPWLAVHAFAFGGIGLITLSMMSRVTLGHTGRNVFEPPIIVQGMFVLFNIGAVVRVLLPLVAPGLYTTWVGVSQALWIVAFVPFVWTFGPMLVKPRVDGRYG